MSLYEDLVQHIRTWARLELGMTEAEAADKIIPAERGALKGSRPPLPFLEIAVQQVGRPIGTDEERVKTTGKKRRGTREGSVRITGYGEETADWLEWLTGTDHSLTTPLSIVQMSPVFDISQLFETNLEYRFVKDFYLAYALVPETPIATATVERVIAPVTTIDGLEGDVDVDWS